MAPYIFMERNGIHILDLYKTAAKLDDAAAVLKNMAKAGKKALCDRALARWYAYQFPHHPQGSQEDDLD